MPADKTDSPLGSGVRSAQGRRTRIPWKLHGMIGLIGIAAVLIVGYGFRTGHRMVADYSALADACVKARLEASYARVRLEVLKENYSDEDAAAVREHIDRAESLTRSILVAADDRAAGARIDDDQVRRRALGMYRQLTEFRTAAEKRVGERAADEREGDLDQRIDVAYESFLKQAEWAEQLVLQLQSRDMQMFQFTQIFLLLCCVILTSSVGASFHRYERGRAVALERTQQANELLLAEIARRERVEKDLRKSQQLVSRTVTRLRDAILIVDSADGSIIDCNPAAADTFGRSKHKLIGVPFSALHVDANSAETFETLRDRAVAEWGFLHLPSYEMRRSNGECFPAEHTTAPLEDDDGHRIGWVSVVRDITARIQAEDERASLQQQLHQWQKMQAVGQLAGGVAHDFNNLLTAISGYVSVARRSLSEDTPALDALNGIDDAVSQAAGVTRSLLTFSRQVPAEKTRVNLSELVSDSAKLLRRVLPANVELSTHSDPAGDAWVYADRTQLQQVLMNLAVNARDAMPEGGTLRVSVIRESSHRRPNDDRSDSQPDTIRLIVADNGEGMPPDVRQRIFEPFFTTKPIGQGTGLGMAIIHGIVSDHGGRIDVQSEVGRGTTVTISLPGVENDAATATRPQLATTPAGDGELILLVEDNHHVRGIIASTLDSFGYETLAVSDGETFLERFAARGQQAQLLVVDVDLPGRNGLDCLNEIRASGALTPAIVITAHADPNLEDQLDPSTVLLRKPFQIAELSALVGNILEANAAAVSQCE